MRVVVVLFLLASCGCTYHRGDFSAISTRAIAAKMEVIEPHVEGRSCKTNWEPRFQLSVDDALKKAPEANALVNVAYRFENLCIVVSGMAVRIAD